METYFIIYKTTCLITNKYYVGMHKTNNLQDGYLGSGKILKRSLNKYGKENHIFEILEYLNDLESLIKRETEIINETLLSDKMCMNLKIGGKGGFREEDRKKGSIAGGKANVNSMRESYLKKVRTDAIFLEKFKEAHSKVHSGEKNGFYGKKHTKEHREKMSDIMSKYSGEKSPQYGTCWITKDFENKKIKKDDLPVWLKDGWIKGRFVEKRN